MDTHGTQLDATLVKPTPDGQAQRVITNGRSITATLPSVQWSTQGPTLHGREVPRYETLDLLGEGGMGAVVRARDNDIGRTVAVKRLRAELTHPELYARFVEEVQIVGQLEHPNIPPIHDAGVDADGFFFVMKHIDGEPLDHLISRLRAGDADAHAQWTFERRLKVMAQVGEALRYAHSKGVVHRDLKPANIIVGRMGEVFVLDWGIATRSQVDPTPDTAPAAPGEVIGTPMYMSPEQARGGTVDARSDIFSLCITFYEFMTLQHPFADTKTAAEVMSAIASTDIGSNALPRASPEPGPGARGHRLAAAQSGGWPASRRSDRRTQTSWRCASRPVSREPCPYSAQSRRPGVRRTS